MTRRRNYFAYRKDAVHDETVSELESDPAAVSVHNTAGAGKGFPDIVVGVRDALTIVGEPSAVAALLSALTRNPVAGLVVHRGANLIVELKSSRRHDSRNTGKQTRDRQEEWRRAWRGQQAKTHSIDETLALVGRRRTPKIGQQEESSKSCVQHSATPKPRPQRPPRSRRPPRSD